MTDTDFFVAVNGEPSSRTNFNNARRYCTPKKQDLVQSLISERTSSLLIMGIADDIGKGKQISKDLFTQFAENIPTPVGSYTQFALYFADDASGDLVQYRCERLTDIDAVVEEEGGEHLCAMTCATTVTPNSIAFDFIDTRLTVVVCAAARYESDDLVNMAKLAASAMACRVRSVCVLLPNKDLLTTEPHGLAAAIEELRVECKNGKGFGRDERMSSRSRMQDVRAWAQSVNEVFRFAPASATPHFVSLSPQFVVGEKLVHAIPEEVTYLVGEGTVASAWDFVALSASTERDVMHTSVYSPHCRISRRGDQVWLKPECGMTYVNGELLKEETQLVHNDRIIVGHQLAFRYVVVTATPSRATGSRILDWELCSKEFRQQCDAKLAKGERNQLEMDNTSLREQIRLLEKELANAQVHVWLILNNPPSQYHGAILWPLDLSGKNAIEEITVGPSNATVTLPFLTNSASLKRDRASFVFKCGSATLPLSHGSRFTIGAYSFSVSLSPDTSPLAVNGASVGGGDLASDSPDVQALRLSCFDLQWAAALLFDFAFPPDTTTNSGMRIDDEYRDYRKELWRETIMSSPGLTVSQLTALNQRLTSALRMIGSGMAKEVNCAYMGCQDSELAASKAKGRNDAKAGANLKAFFEKVEKMPTISAALLQRYHTEAGLLLMALNSSAAGGGDGEGSSPSKRNSPKKGRGGRNSGEGRSPSALPDGQVPALSNLSVLSNGGGSPRERVFEAWLMNLKGRAYLASPQVIRRAGTVMDLLAVSPNPKAIWEKYLKVLNVIPVPEGSLVMRQNYFLSILDVLISSEFCFTRGMLAKGEVRQLEMNMDRWQDLLGKFASSFDEPSQQKRSVWRHEAALQKRATPRLRPSSVRAPCAALGSSVGGRSVAAVSSPKAAAAANRSSTPLGRRSSSRTREPMSKPKRSLSTGVSSGRTPPTLSTFGGSVKGTPSRPTPNRCGSKPSMAPPSPASNRGEGAARVRPGSPSTARSPRSPLTSPRAGPASARDSSYHNNAAPAGRHLAGTTGQTAQCQSSLTKKSKPLSN